MARILTACLTATFLLGAVARPAMAQTTWLFMHSQPGDYIGAGQTRMYTTVDGNFSAQRNSANSVTVRFDGGTVAWWYLNFAAPQGALLTVGTYNGAQRYPFQSPTLPGLDVSGSGRGCNQLTGRFKVLEVVYGSGDTILSFSANFEQHCEGMSPALFGSIRYNAAAVAPHTVTVARQGTGGSVESLPAGISCGNDCTETFNDGIVVGLVPQLSGAGTVQWSGDADCSDGVIFDGASAVCTATFVPCSIVLTPGSATGTSGGGFGSLAISTNGPSCEWSGVTSAPWLRVLGDGSGTGSGTLGYTYDPRGQFSQPRSATIAVNNQTFTLTQSGIMPVFTVTPLQVVVGPGNVSTSVQVSANTPDAIWTAWPTTSWIYVPGSGPVGAATMTIARNPTATPRTGSLLIGGHTVTISQRENGRPGEPSELAAAVQQGRARFAWRPPALNGDATSFQLEAGVTPGAASFVFNTTDGTPGVDVNGVPPGRFYLRVRAHNEFGLGPASEEYTLTVDADGMNAPGRPAGITAAMLGSRLVMAWTPPIVVGALDGYILEVGSVTGSSDLAVLPLGLATTFTYDPVPSGFYFLRVRGLNSAGLGASSDEVLISAGGVPSPPGAPEALSSALSSSTVNLNWTASPSGGPASRYRIEVGSARGLSDLAVIETQVAATAIGFVRVPPGRYFVRVRGTNALGIGPVSNEVRVDVPPVP
jgi:hypothetical protein